MRIVKALDSADDGIGRPCDTASLEQDHMRTWTTRISLSVVSMLLVLPPAAAQTADELAKQTQNPVASLISAPLQGNWDFALGDREATATLLNIQPVIPFGISKGTNVILRVIMPLTSQPGSISAGVSVEATGNWEADEAWTAPLLFSVSKVTLLGKRPVNLALAAGPTIASPDGGASWRFRLVATFLFPR